MANVPPDKQTGARFPELVAVMDRLLAPDGCPWDREQTLATLRSYLIEEAYEVLEAIDAADPAGHRDELGDLLFQIVFQSALRAREGHFGVDDVCDAIAAKMVHRHPHVFGETKVRDSAEVLENWGKLKEKELKDAGKQRRTLDGVPAALPALLRAQRLGEKAAGVGFDWPDVQGIRDKVAEEVAELDEAIAQGDPRAVEHEMGDLLFTLTRLSARLGVAPEDALRAANARFEGRFRDLEQSAVSDGKKLKEMSLEEMEVYWQQAKARERAGVA
jgi:tetrapyrrole methylase family protein / MazG family protein